MLPMTVTVEADPLFGFDQDSIGAEARKKLDELIQQLKGIPYGEVITLGYADPIGTEAYNQKLSERRAASVTRYLVSNGIPRAKIRVEARGETEEFASYKACKAQGKQKLIDCLQPDRRVEVTVTTAKEQ
jgi:OOP family OmpA-OmpF porin